MNSEFQQLAQKVDQLALLARTMRAENTELRLKVAELASENVALSDRVRHAHDRVTAILEKLPLAEQEAE